MNAPDSNHDGAPAEILAVADWSVDPGRVVESLRAVHDRGAAVFRLLVPARLPGLEWIGDPRASCPCARRQLVEIERRARSAGLAIESADVGDPERVAAIRTALEARPAERILLFDRARVLAVHPLSVARRVARHTGRRVERIAIRNASEGRRRAPRCIPAEAPA
jgi:hypothetical protein